MTPVAAPIVPELAMPRHTAQAITSSVMASVFLGAARRSVGNGGYGARLEPAVAVPSAVGPACPAAASSSPRPVAVAAPVATNGVGGYAAGPRTEPIPTKVVIPKRVHDIRSQ